MLISMGDSAVATETIRQNVERFGPAPGAKKMLTWEKEAADLAVSTGLYTVWRSTTSGQDCTRVGPSSRCFCGHLYKSHAEGGGPCCVGKDGPPCKCKRFEFIPRRPEEVGEWWMPRRKGFNVITWRAKCRCKHGHDDHMPPGSPYSKCRAPGCGCGHFNSDFLCVVCDKHWEDHETVTETASERKQAGKPVGAQFYPLSDTPDIQALVFGTEALSLEGASSAAAFEHASEDQQLAALRGAVVKGRTLAGSAGGSGSSSGSLQSTQWAPRNPVESPEKSIRLSAVNSGGKAPVKGDPRYMKK